MKHILMFSSLISQAIMKSYVATGSDSANPEKFLAYMVPSVNEVDTLRFPILYL